MVCPHCAASISENEERCPYCNSYIDHGWKKQNEPVQNEPHRNFMGYDKTEPSLVILSLMIPIVGIILGIIQISGGRPKSGRCYLMVSAISFVLFFCGTFIFPMLFSLLTFSRMK